MEVHRIGGKEGMLELCKMNLEDAKAQWEYAGLVCAGDLLLSAGTQEQYSFF